MTGTKFLSSDVPTTQDCIDLCIVKNSSCNAVEWWENGPNDCYECIKPSLRTEYNDDSDESYPPHVLIKPKKAAGKFNVRDVFSSDCPPFFFEQISTNTYFQVIITFWQFQCIFYDL